MKFFNRTIPVLVPIIIFAIIEQIFQAPKQIYWLLPLSFAVLVVAVWQLVGRQLFRQQFWRFIIAPSLLLFSGLMFLSFLEGKLLRQIFLFGLAILLWSFLEVLFIRLHASNRYQTHSLENISIDLNLIILFLTASGFFSLMIFLGVDWWFLLPALVIIVALLTVELVWSGETNRQVGVLYILVITLITAEIFWSVSFLPTSVYVNGLIVTLGYYLMTGLARNWLLGVRQLKALKRYLLISALCFIIIIVTAKWF